MVSGAGFCLGCALCGAPVARLAFEGARNSAKLGKDAFQRGAVLAWPIRAALEVHNDSLAREMLDDALAMIPATELFCSRAVMFDLLLQAVSNNGSDFREPLLALLPAYCPPDSHWRVARLYRDIASLLREVHPNHARAFAETMPAGKAQDRILRDRVRGKRLSARSFFW